MKGFFTYDREKAVRYARTWAMRRNPRYVDFENMGGDCTNFASQVLYAGNCPMNFRTYGWYYKDLDQRAPSWTGVEFLYQFLMSNKITGPVAVKSSLEEIEMGDLVQIKFSKDGYFDHTPVVVKILRGRRSRSKILIAAHSIDRIDYPLSNYAAKELRFIHIKGYRK